MMPKISSFHKLNNSVIYFKVLIFTIVEIKMGENIYEGANLVEVTAPCDLINIVGNYYLK